MIFRYTARECTEFGGEEAFESVHSRAVEHRPWHDHYDEGIGPSLDYEDLTLTEFLARSARDYPDTTALVFMNLSLTYRQLKDEVDRLATALRGLGVVKGTRVAIQLPNLPQAVIAYYGALGAGAEVVLTNPLYTAREIEHQWGDAECDLAVVADFLYARTIRPARERLRPRTYIVASIPEYLRFPLNLLAPMKLRRQEPPLVAQIPRDEGVHRFRDLIKATPCNPPVIETSPDDIAVLQYTGGTTGVSKGAVLTHRNLSVNVQQINSWFKTVEFGKEAVLTSLPLFHVFGMTVSMNWPVYSAAKMVLLPNPRDMQAMVKGVQKHGVTLFPGVPAMFNALNNHPGINKSDVSSIKACFSGSAPIADDVLQRFEALTGSVIIEGFGMSETSPATHCNPLVGARKLGSVGLPLPDTDARIVDVDDPSTVLENGQEGELCISGPQVMREYWNQPEETAKTLRDGWLHTGDLAVMDDEGYFRIVGRKKDMINAGGYKVFPDEVDGVLMAHKSILEAATIGIPDPKRGETVKSFVVLQPGATLSADEITAYCRENLAAYKIPRSIAFLDELPKSTVLKVLRRELRDLETTE